MITLICTTLNEGESIRPLLDSIAAQTRLPDEIIFVDGGSRDHTAAIIESYAGKLPIRVIVAPGCNISAGRNVAINAARGDIIAAIDAGVRLSPTWFESITRPFDDPQVEVVGGFFQADPHTLFEAAMGAAVLPLADEIDPATFLPSSRSVAFRKAAWALVGGYPEWIDYCEDLIFDLRLKATAKPFAFAPDALVYFRPRASLRAYFKQYYRYARGDGKADLWRKRHAIRYLTYLVAAPLILLLGALVNPLFWLLVVPGVAVYFQRPYRRLPIVLRHLPPVSIFGLLYAVVLIPVIRVVGDVAKMTGYPVGRRWRFTHHPPDWRITSPPDA